MKKEVIHLKYGRGTIVAIEKAEGGYWVTIMFEGVGEKKLLMVTNRFEFNQTEMEVQNKRFLRWNQVVDNTQIRVEFKKKCDIIHK